VLLVVLRRLIEQEIRSELLVLVTRKVCLDGQVSGEAQKAQLGTSTIVSPCSALKTRGFATVRLGLTGTYPLNSRSLLLRDADGVRARRQRRAVLALAPALAEQLDELIRVLLDQRCELRVPGRDLLHERLEHLRLRLHHLPQLLELLVVAQEVEAAAAARPSQTGETLGPGSSSGTTSSASGPASGTPAGPSLAGLCGRFEEIHGRVVVF